MGYNTVCFPLSSAVQSSYKLNELLYLILWESVVLSKIYKARRFTSATRHLNETEKTNKNRPNTFQKRAAITVIKLKWPRENWNHLTYNIKKK